MVAISASRREPGSTVPNLRSAWLIRAVDSIICAAFAGHARWDASGQARHPLSSCDARSGIGNTAVQVDGELIGKLPMTFEIAPQSIEVIVP